MIKEEFAKRILGLERFNVREVSFLQNATGCLSQLDGYEVVFGFTGQKPWRKLRCISNSAFLSFSIHIYWFLCLWESGAPPHEASVSLFPSFGGLSRGDILPGVFFPPSNHRCGGSFSFKHSKAHDVHVESLGWCPPWLWERSQEVPKQAILSAWSST